MEVHVTIRSADGSVQHPFKSETAVSTVKQYAFEQLKPTGISEQQTFLTFGGTRITNEGQPLSAFATGEHKETALFVLTWENVAGRR